MAQQQANAPSMIPGSRTKLTVRQVQQMKGKEQIAMAGDSIPGDGHESHRVDIQLAVDVIILLRYPKTSVI